MKPEDFARKIKSKYPQYQDVPDFELAQRVITKYPAYKSQVKMPSELGQDIKETFTGVKNAFSSAFGKQKEALGKSAEGEQSNTEGLFQAAGEGARGLSRAIGEAVIGVGKAVLPQSFEDAISKTAEKTIGKVLDSQTARDISTSIEEFEKANPRAARNIKGLLGFGELGLDVVGGTGGKQVARKLITGTEKLAETAIDTTKTVANKTVDITKAVGGEAANTIKDFGVSQLTGLNPETVRLVVDNIDDFKKAKEAGLSRFTVAKQVEDSLNTRLEELSEIGKQYEAIRRSGEVAQLPQGWLEKEIQNQGFVIKDGKVRANTKSPTRDTNDLSGIQKFYEDWNGKTQLEADEFLNLRYDLSKLSKFGKEVGRSDELENFGRRTREGLNNYREQLTGLKELDETFAPEKTVLDNLKKEFLDKDGNLKDTAINRIANSTGKGKDQLLDRLTELVPDVKQRVNLVKALEDVEYAKGQKVGTYTRALLGGGLIISGSIPAGLALITISSPENVLKILEFYVKRVKPTQAKVINSIKGKMQNGKGLDPAEAKIMSQILNMSKETAKRIAETVETATGVGVVEGAKKEVTK